MNLTPVTQATMSSREIADLTGSRHDAVRKSAERLATDQILTSPLATFNYEHRGNTYQEYRFDKRDSLVLVARLSPEFTAAVVDRWQELESGPYRIPQSMAEALRLAADQQEQIEQQQLAIEAARPSVEFVDRYVSADSGNKGFRQVAKLLQANERELREFLKNHRVMYFLGGEWMPYQNHIDADRFIVKTGVTDDGAHSYSQAKFTPKGVNWIAGLWAQYKLEGAA